MSGLCRRCGGSGWLLRNPERQSELQRERSFSDKAFGRRLTRCTDCSGSGVTSKKFRFEGTTVHSTLTPKR